MLQVFPPTVLPPSGRLLWPNTAPAYIREAHEQNCGSGAVDLVELEGVAIGGLGLLLRDGDLLFPKDVFPTYVEPIAKKLRASTRPNSRVWLGALLNGDWSTKVVDSPVIAPFHPNWVYGHVLLEMLPKLVLLDLLLPPDIPVAVASSNSEWMLSLIHGVVPRREIVTYDHHKEILQPKSVLTCTNIVTHLGKQSWFHPAVREIMQIAKARSILAQSPMPGTFQDESDSNDVGSGLIYVSRSQVKPSWHALSKENETRIERKLTALGFQIVHPQKLTVSDQMRVFSSARIIVGEFSSALHNAVFSPPGTAVVCLNCINDYQSKIATAFGHSVGYIEPVGGYREFEAERSGAQEMEVRVGRLVARLTALMADLGSPPSAAGHSSGRLPTGKGTKGPKTVGHYASRPKRWTTRLLRGMHRFVHIQK